MLSAPPPLHADLIVVGAGLAGLSAALILAKAGVSVAVLDAQPAEALPPSAMLPGLLGTGTLEHPQRLLHAVGPDGYATLRQLAQRSQAQAHALLGYQPGGLLWRANEPSDVRRLHADADALRAVGQPVRWLDALQASQWIGAPSPFGGLLHPTDGHVDATALHRALRQAATLAGAALHHNHAVTALDTSGPRVRLALEHGGHAEAELVVLCAGIGQRALHPSLEAHLFSVRESVLSVPCAQPPGPTRSSQASVALSPGPGQRALLSGCRWASPHFEIGERHGPTPEPVRAALARTLGQLRPDLAEAAAHAIPQAHLLAHSQDGLPLLGPLGVEGRLWVCGGFGGNELAMGLGAGAWVAEALLGSDGPPLPNFLSARRLAWL